MTGYSSDLFDEEHPLCGHSLPGGDRGLTDTEPGRELADDADRPLADQPDANALQGIDHAADISLPSSTAQDPIIGPTDTDLSDNPSMALAKLIQDARMRLKLRQEDLARLIQVKQSAVSQWEVGKFEPDLENRIKLAGALQIPLFKLLPEAGDLPEAALSDPQVRLLVANYIALSPNARAAVDLIVQQLRVSAEQGR